MSCLSTGLTLAVYAKTSLSQVNDRQNFSATVRNVGFVCHNDR